MSNEDEYDTILREKAKQEGVSFEDYKRSVLPFISPTKDSPEELKRKLGMVQETAKTYGEIEKSGAPPPIKIKLANATGNMMGKIMSSRVEPGVEKMTTSLARAR